MLSLPPEILDVIVDHLDDEPTALRACCLVSKSWVWRTRRYLFDRVEFNSARSSVEKWIEVFQEPSNSPVHHTQILWISGRDVVATTSVDGLTWIRSFRGIKELLVDTKDTPRVSLVHFHGLSPTLTSLCLFHFTNPSSEVLDLVCSFPLLEDLFLTPLGTERDTNRWEIPSTSPKLTGYLSLSGGLRSIPRGLLDLPNGLRFTKISVMSPVKDAELAGELVLGCSATLESLRIDYLATSLLLPPPLDLSKATKLRDVGFRWDEPDIQWITTSLQTAQLKSLQRVIFTFAAFPLNTTEEKIREWQDLDRLLDRLWTSHSVPSNIVYNDDPGMLAPCLFPELMKRGALYAAQG